MRCRWPPESGDPALADHRVVAVGKPLDELGRLRDARRFLDLLVGRVHDPERDVVANGGGEEEGILRDDADRLPQRPEGDVADVDAVEQDAAARDVVEARTSDASVVFPEPVCPISATIFPGSTSKSTSWSTERAGCVLEADVAVGEAARSVGEREGAGLVVDLLGLVHDLEDALARRRRALRLADPHAEHAEGHDEHQHEEVEGEEGAVRQRAVDHHAPTDEEDGALREQREERQQRHVDRALPVRAHALAEHLLGRALELLLLGLLLRERPDHVDADDVLLGVVATSAIFCWTSRSSGWATCE